MMRRMDRMIETQNSNLKTQNHNAKFKTDATLTKPSPSVTLPVGKAGKVLLLLGEGVPSLSRDG